MPVTFALRLSDDGSPNGREKVNINKKILL